MAPVDEHDAQLNYDHTAASSGDMGLGREAADGGSMPASLGIRGNHGRSDQAVQLLLVGSYERNAMAIAALVGIAPDEVMVRGSRAADPPVPVAHAWKIVADDRSLRGDERAAQLFVRLRPAEAQLLELSADRGCWLVLQVVRYFDDEAGEEEILSSPEDRFQKLSGQHQLLGWHFDADDLAFLARIGAHLDVDEYG